jgi:two-component system competent response regulator ComA
VEAFAASCFDVVLLDAVMPGMGGAATFDALREIRPDAVVLMASGFDMERAVGDLLERGLAGFIGKPFRGDDLVARVSGLIEQTQKHSG